MTVATQRGSRPRRTSSRDHGADATRAPRPPDQPLPRSLAQHACASVLVGDDHPPLQGDRVLLGRRDLPRPRARNRCPRSSGLRWRTPNATGTTWSPKKREQPRTVGRTVRRRSPTHRLRPFELLDQRENSAGSTSAQGRRSPRSRRTRSCRRSRPRPAGRRRRHPCRERTRARPASGSRRRRTRPWRGYP